MDTPTIDVRHVEMSALRTLPAPDLSRTLAALPAEDLAMLMHLNEAGAALSRGQV